jgi:hypothetical protein
MVVGKTARTKNWVTGQKIESFSDLEGDSGDSNDSGSEDEAVNDVVKKKGAGGLNGFGGGEDDDDSEGEGLDPANDWDTFEDHARRNISTSRTSDRTHFLSDVLLRNLKKNSKRWTPHVDKYLC